MMFFFCFFFWPFSLQCKFNITVSTQIHLLYNPYDAQASSAFSALIILAAVSLGTNLNESFCYSRKKTIFFENRPHFGRAMLSRELHRKSQKLSPFVKIME